MLPRIFIKVGCVANLDVVSCLTYVNPIKPSYDTKRFNLNSHVRIDDVDYIICNIFAFTTNGKVVNLPDEVSFLPFVIGAEVQIYFMSACNGT